MFGKLKERLSKNVQKLSGNQDFLEAVCAAAALTAFADKECSDDELEMALKTVKSNPTLSDNFTVAQIEKTMDGMLKRAQAGRTGKMGLMKEIEECSEDMAETVYLCALDVAEAEGGIDSAEQKVLDKLASTLGVNQSAYEF